MRLASRRAIVEAREREQLKDEFVAMLSHELRTPVTRIHAAAQILSRIPSVLNDARARELFPTSHPSQSACSGSSRTCWSCRALERGTLEAAREPVLLQRVLPKAVDHESRRWPDRTIGLYVCRRLAMGGRIWADAAPDEGTVFTLPPPDPAGLKSRAGPTGSGRAAPGIGSPRPGRLTIVDSPGLSTRASVDGAH